MTFLKNEWIDKINSDLQTKDSYEKLIKENTDGIKVEPVYTNLDSETCRKINPKTLCSNWHVITEVFHDKPSEILKLIQKSIKFDSNVIEINSELGLNGIYGIDFSEIKKDFFEPFLNESFSIDANLLSFFQLEEINTCFTKHNNNVLITHDPLALKLKYPNFLFEKGLNRFIETIENNHFSIRLDARDCHYLGSDKISTIAFTILKLKFYLSNLSDKHIELFLKNLSIRFPISIDYFEEIACLRATKIILSILSEELELKELENIKLEAENSILDFSKYDVNNNYLRACSQTMSAAISGYDRILCKAHNRNISYNTEHSNRIAINTNHLLKEESYINLVKDPVAGSYYLENLTDKYLGEIWELLIAFEEKGDYLNLITSSEIYKFINKSRYRRQNQYEHRKKFVLGLSHYPNLEDEFPLIYKNQTAKSFNLNRFIKDKSIIEDFKPYHDLEKLRMETEKSETMKPVFLLVFGDKKMRSLRSDFITDFISSAGFKIVKNSNPDDFDSSYEEYKRTDSNVLILCSSDDEYLDVINTVNKEKYLYLTGLNKSNVDIKSINLKSNFIETIKSIQNELEAII